jgi:hypothetical protein
MIGRTFLLPSGPAGFDRRVIDVGAIYLVRSPPEFWVHEFSYAGACFIWR